MTCLVALSHALVGWIFHRKIHVNPFLSHAMQHFLLVFILNLFDEGSFVHGLVTNFIVNPEDEQGEFDCQDEEYGKEIQVIVENGLRRPHEQNTDSN